MQRKFHKLSTALALAFTVPALAQQPVGRTPAAPSPALAAASLSDTQAPPLRGLVIISSPGEANVTVPPGFAGIDTSRAGLLRTFDAQVAFADILGQPLSLPLLERAGNVIRDWLRDRGEKFFVVYVPPQDVNDGVVRLVVARARLDGDILVSGADWFSEASYRKAVPLQSGQEIDSTAIQAGLDYLNSNNFRQVTLAAEPGHETGSTRLALQVKETRPLQLTAGFNNSGSPATNEKRYSAGVTWGNAFGLGDSVGYNLSADPAFKHSRSHSLNYGMVFYSGNVLALSASHSTIQSIMPEPFTQKGVNWQLGSRYTFKPMKTSWGWERGFHLSADYKYADNNIEFSTIPVTNNVTRIVQFGAGLMLSRAHETNRSVLSATVYASPGGLAQANEDVAFQVWRAGAHARYAYLRLDLNHTQNLPGGWQWEAQLDGQLASGPLMGSEQLSGGGTSSVRAYPESSTFGDRGVVWRNTLHLPAITQALLGQDHRADFYLFSDAAWLHRFEQGGASSRLASAGLGLNYRIGRGFMLGAAYGRTLSGLPRVETGSGRAHLNASLSF